MTQSKAPFTISYRFLKLLAKHVFGNSPVIAIRELIQNGHDAVLMRAASQRTGDRIGWGVQIDLFPDERRISILDTGIGMKPQDITNSLTRLGEGEKTEAKRKEWETLPHPEMLKNVAGVFGMGFVAATIVSKRIEIWTKSQDGPATYCCFNEENAEGFYEEQEDPRMTPSIGTRVLLHLGSEGGRITDDVLPSAKGGTLTDQNTVRQIIEKYCDLLEFDIAVSTGGMNRTVVNRSKAPWEQGPRPSQKDMLSFFKRRFGENLNDPIEYIPFEFTRDVHRVEASGVLYVPKPSLRSAGQEGPLDVFVKRIWTCDDDTEVLPEWCRFLSGVIITPDVAVNLERRHLDKDDVNYHNLAVALREHLRKHFVDMAAKRRDDFTAFLDVHGMRFEAGLLAARAKYEGTRPAWFADLVRVLPFHVYSSQFPTGYRANVNELLGVEPAAPITRLPNGEKRLLHGVNRVLLAEQQSEFREVLADKTYPIIVPETDREWYRLGVIGSEFEDVLQVANVEATFTRDFFQPIGEQERDRWNLFIQFLQDLLRIGTNDKVTANVSAASIPKTKLPILIHWKPTHTSGEEPEEAKEAGIPRPQFQQMTTINVSHELMSDLLKFVEDKRLRRIEPDSVVGACLHMSYHLASLEQNASLRKATFYDILKRNLEIMKLALSQTKEIESLKTARDRLQGEVAQSQDEARRLKKQLEAPGAVQSIAVPEEPEFRNCAIVFVDIIRSTPILIGVEQENRGRLFARWAKELAKIAAECKGFFDKFTGDGALVAFGASGTEESHEACNNAYRFAQKARALTNDFADMEGVRSLVDALIPEGAPGAGLFRSRISISYGKVAFGRYGTSASFVGRPVVEAARVCSDKDLYGDAPGIVISQFVFGPLGAPPGFQRCSDNYVAEGLGVPIQLYKAIV